MVLAALVRALVVLPDGWGALMGYNGQCLSVLPRANEQRVAGAAVRAELAAGQVTVAQALEDPRSGSLSVHDLLCSPPKWGPARAEMVLRPQRMGVAGEMIWPLRRVRELTERERRLIVERVALIDALRRRR